MECNDSLSLKNLMTKITHVTSAHPRDDIRIFTKECLTLCDRFGDVMLVVADGNGNDIFERLKIVDVGKSHSGRVKRMLLASRSVAMMALQNQSSIVHFHDPEIIPWALLLKRRGLKVVYDVHEDVPRQILEKHWIPRPLRKMISRIFEKFENYAVEKFDGVVAATPVIRERFVGLNANVVNVCNFPITSEFVSGVPWESRNNEICYIGSLSRNRGIESLISSLVDAKTRLNLAGSWSDDGLKQSISSNPGWAFVNELGSLDRSGVSSVLSRSKVGIVTLFPTKNYVDSLPIKLFEYMAAGIPVIASDFPRWRQIVEQAKCGLLVDPYDSAAIGQAIRWILEHQDEAKVMGESGRKAVAERYNWDFEAKKLVTLYEDLLA
jgi:glycosyltransferase involved in cell wall biosynthesis